MHHKSVRVYVYLNPNETADGVLVATKGLSSGQTLSDFSNNEVKELNNYSSAGFYKNFKILNETNSTFAGKPAHNIVWSGIIPVQYNQTTPTNTSVQEMQTYVVNNNMGYVSNLQSCCQRLRHVSSASTANNELVCADVRIQCLTGARSDARLPRLFLLECLLRAAYRECNTRINMSHKTRGIKINSGFFKKAIVRNAGRRKSNSQLTYLVESTNYVKKQFRCYAVLFDLAVHLTQFSKRYLYFTPICIFSLLNVNNSKIGNS